MITFLFKYWENPYKWFGCIHTHHFELLSIQKNFALRTDIFNGFNMSGLFDKFQEIATSFQLKFLLYSTNINEQISEKSMNWLRRHQSMVGQVFIRAFPWVMFVDISTHKMFYWNDRKISPKRKLIKQSLR